MTDRNLFLLSIKDFMTPRILKLAILPFIISMIVVYALFFSAAHYGLDQLEQAMAVVEQSQTLADAPAHTSQVDDFVTSILRYSIVYWIAAFLLYTVGSMLVFFLSIVLALLIIGFLTGPILSIVQERHYNDVEIRGYGSLGDIMLVFLKSFLIMLLLLVLLVPLYFVPLINLIAINVPFYYFFHKLMLFDVASTLLSKEEHQQIYTTHANGFRLKTLLLYLLSLIPFAILFATPFSVIYLGHHFFDKVKSLRTSRPQDAITS
jgi:hypothetical protein